MKKEKMLLSIIPIFCGLLVTNNCYAGITLPRDVRDIADMLHTSALDQKQKIAAMEETEKNIAALEREILRIKNEYQENTAYKNSLRQQLIELRQQLAGINSEHDARENKLIEIQQKKSTIESQNEESEKIVERYDEGRKGYFAYHNILAREKSYYALVEQEDQIDEEISVLDEKILALEQVISDLEEKMEQEDISEDGVIEEEEQKVQLKLLEADLEAAKSTLAEYNSGTDIVARKSSSFNTESKYYSWHDDKGNKGIQFYQPFYYNEVVGPWEYGIAAGLISSDNKSNDNGKVNCFTDTSLNVAYTKKGRASDLMVFSLEINLPTGKEALHEFDPVMDEDLVEKARFGEGLNFTPAIWYYYNHDQKNTFIFGTYYTFSGKYDLTPVTWVEPGNAWVKEIRWQHINNKMQFLAGVSHTSYAKTKENDLEYTSGNQFKPEITFNYAPDNTQFFTAYYWHTQEDPLRYSTFDNITETRHGKNYGLQWAKDVSGNRRIRLLVDWLRSNGENYNPLTDISTNHRRKTTLGIGVDQYFKNRSEKLSFDVEVYKMQDGALNSGDSDIEYSGRGIYLKYLKNI